MSEHGTISRYTQGCRCDACREASRIYQLNRRRARGIQPRQASKVHGTVNQYTNLGCRCDECRAAWRAHHSEYMARTPEQREKARLAQYRRRGVEPKPRKFWRVDPQEAA